MMDNDKDNANDSEPDVVLRQLEFLFKRFHDVLIARYSPKVYRTPFYGVLLIVDGQLLYIRDLTSTVLVKILRSVKTSKYFWK